MYSELRAGLAERGITSFLQSPNQLVIAASFPNFPTQNTFWITNRGGVWHVGTFLPTIYQVPAAVDICVVCEEILKSSATAIYKVNDDLVQKHSLTRLSDEQREGLLSSMHK